MCVSVTIGGGQKGPHHVPVNETLQHTYCIPNGRRLPGKQEIV